MKISKANTIGEEIAVCIRDGDVDSACALIEPKLKERIPFSSLDRIGVIIGKCSLETVNLFLTRIADGKTMGGWVVIGSALGEQLDRDFCGAFMRGRDYIIAGDAWYTADILGERVPGPGLVNGFDQGIASLKSWRLHHNHWVRRTVGVSAHYWAKRSRGAEKYTSSAEELLIFLTPMFCEWNMDAAKGIGWGIKTLGKYYPQLVTAWLVDLLRNPQIHYRALMLRKATTYLQEAQKEQVKSVVK